MGVAITAYSNLKLVESHARSESCYDGHIHAFTYASFRRSAEGLADVDVESSLGNATVVADRCYETTDRTRAVDILSMSYGGYNRWRETLALVATGKSADLHWVNPDPSMPFMDLINFADNEGCIGPVAAKRLLGDFQKISADAAVTPAIEGWSEINSQWIAGLEAAADDGLIRFA